MDKTLNSISNKDIPSFEKINRYNVAIQSLKNQLRQSQSIEELTSIASKIIELEQQIVVEKTSGYKKLEKEKKDIEAKIDKIRRELVRSEQDLARIGNSLDLKLSGYRKILQGKIESLSQEYETLLEKIDIDG